MVVPESRKQSQLKMRSKKPKGGPQLLRTAQITNCSDPFEYRGLLVEPVNLFIPWVTLRVGHSLLLFYWLLDEVENKNNNTSYKKNQFVTRSARRAVLAVTL